MHFVFLQKNNKTSVKYRQLRLEYNSFSLSTSKREAILLSHVLLARNNNCLEFPKITRMDGICDAFILKRPLDSHMPLRTIEDFHFSNGEFPNFSLMKGISIYLF